LLNEGPTHPELSQVIDALKQNLKGATKIIAYHQAEGNLKAGNPFQTLLALLSPLVVGGFWMRMGFNEQGVELDVESLVDAFLDGHRNTAT